MLYHDKITLPLGQNDVEMQPLIQNLNKNWQRTSQQVQVSYTLMQENKKILVLLWYRRRSFKQQHLESG